MGSTASQQGKQEPVRQRPMLWVSLESARARRDRRHSKKAYSAARAITTLATDERTMAAMSSVRRWWCLSTTITPATTSQKQNDEHCKIHWGVAER